MRLIKPLAAAAVLFFPVIASADQCFGASPFTDVPADANYCSNVEWLKNRNITLGCVGTNYCPSDAVTRASMALFLNRLGVVLSPEVLHEEAPSGVLNLDLTEPNSVYCQTDDFTVTGYPRHAQIMTAFAGLAAGALNYEHQIAYSTDSGATWLRPMGQINRSGAAGIQWVNSSIQYVMNLGVGVTYRWGIQLERTAGAPVTTADFSSSRCFNTVLIHHRNIPLN